jgi:hypothetical protein
LGDNKQLNILYNAALAANEEKSTEKSIQAKMHTTINHIPSTSKVSPLVTESPPNPISSMVEKNAYSPSSSRPPQPSLPMRAPPSSSHPPRPISKSVIESKKTPSPSSPCSSPPSPSLSSIQLGEDDKKKSRVSVPRSFVESSLPFVIPLPQNIPPPPPRLPPLRHNLPALPHNLPFDPDLPK